MKALFISNDPKIFDPKSPSCERMRLYAAGIGELHVLSAAPFGAKASDDGPLHLHPVFVPKLFRIASLARRARALITQHGIEVVSAQDPFEHGLAAMRAVEGTAAKLHVQVHTDFLSIWFLRTGNWRSPQIRMPFLNRFRRNMADQVLPRAHGIRVVSARIKDSLTKRYGSAIVEPAVLPVMVSAEVPPPVPLPARPFTYALICVGRLEPEKRIEDILAALKLVVVQYPMVGLILVGEGRERRKLERMVRALGLAEHVVFCGARADAWGLMRSAQCFIQASAYEGYGRTFIEAALAKIPIVTTDVGIIGDVFKPFDDVLSVPVADPTALSLAIVGLVEDTRVRLELVQHAEAAARAHLAAQGDLAARIAEDLRRGITQ